VLGVAWVVEAREEEDPREEPAALPVLVASSPHDPSVLHCPLLHSFSPVGQRACTVRVRVAVASWP
jgi:hypothetical protein